MEDNLDILNKYFKLINLKSFCSHYEMSYDFTRKVLLGKRTLTDSFFDILCEKIAKHQADQSEIYRELF